jgi:hypothetical protein
MSGIHIIDCNKSAISETLRGVLADWLDNHNATLRLHGCAQHGFSEEQVVDTVLITCTFNFMVA